MRVSHLVVVAALLLIATVATASETGADANNAMLNQAKVRLAEKLFKFENPVINGDKATVRAISGKQKCKVTLVRKEVLPATKSPALQLEAAYGWFVDNVVCK